MRSRNSVKWLGVWMVAFILVCVSSGFASLLPAGSFEWPLNNPNNEYEGVSFDANTPISALGGWKINTSSNYAEVYKVRGDVGSVFPLAAPDSETYYVTLGSYIANNAFALYSDPIILEAGKTYQVSGYVSSAYGLGSNTGTWAVNLGNTNVVTGDLSLLQRGTWTPVSFTYVAGVVNPSMGVGWTKTDSNHARVLFDGMSVVEVPEPITLLTLLSGGLFIFRRRA